jgi:hypothetical protein
MWVPKAAPTPAHLRAQNEPPPSPDSHLESEINAAIDFSYKQTKLFGLIHYSFRVALIVLSVCVSAKGITFLLSAAPALSLLVAIGTGLDTWLTRITIFFGSS